MTVFDKLLADFAAMTGLQVAADAQNSCQLETDGLIITLQYRSDADDLVIFAPVTDSDGNGGLVSSQYKKALSLAYDGKGTSGASLGLFDGELVLSVHLPMNGLDAETLGVRLTAFTDAAISVRAEIAAETGNGASVEAAPAGQEDGAFRSDELIRV